MRLFFSYLFIVYFSPFFKDWFLPHTKHNLQDSLNMQPRPPWAPKITGFSTIAGSLKSLLLLLSSPS